MSEVAVNRSRSGQTMPRSRVGILAGAARCVARYGTRKTTMGDIAREARVAKATLYNHFRSKPDVYAALLEHEVRELLGAVVAVDPPGTAEGVHAAMSLAATAVSQHSALRALAASEPATLVPFATVGSDPLWEAVRACARDRISLAQAAGALHPQHDTDTLVDTALRWVLSHIWTPGDAATVAAGSAVVVAGFVAAPGRVVAEAVRETA